MVTRRQALAAAAGGAWFLSKARKAQANQGDSSGRGWARTAAIANNGFLTVVFPWRATVTRLTVTSGRPDKSVRTNSS